VNYFAAAAGHARNSELIELIGSWRVAGAAGGRLLPAAWLKPARRIDTKFPLSQCKKSRQIMSAVSG